MKIENNITIDINEVISLALLGIDESLDLFSKKTIILSILPGKPDQDCMTEQSQELPDA